MAETSEPSLDHHTYMRLAIAEAKKSPPKPSNFRVGALIVDASSGYVLTTSYTLELPGNTHAEQRVGEVLPENAVLYTTMEPCAKRLSGNMPCVERILRTQSSTRGVRTVYLGVKEPEIFIGKNKGRARLEEGGVECVHIPGFEEEILGIATQGHVKGD